MKTYRWVPRCLAIVILSGSLLGVIFTIMGACTGDTYRATRAEAEPAVSSPPAQDAHGTTSVEPAMSPSPTRDIYGTTSAEPTVSTSPEALSTCNPNSPTQTVKLIFIHHSVGGWWLGDGHGRLGIELANNNYFVSDVSAGWGPNSIGDHTDYGWWWEWFGGEQHEQILAELSAENGQTSGYTRLPDPGGENEIIMIKPCFSNYPVCGNPDDPPTSGDDPPRNFGTCASCFEGCLHTVGNIKRVFVDILETFRQHPEKLFVIVTAPPPMESSVPDNENGRALSNWIYYDWLDGYDGNNVVVFDLFDVWTTNGGDYDTNDLGWSTGNHHRLTLSPPLAIEHITNGDDDANPNVMEYPSCCWNAHPNQAGCQKATEEFVLLLNAYYNCWKYGQCCPGMPSPTLEPSKSASPHVPRYGDVLTYTLLVVGEGGTLTVTDTIPDGTTYVEGSARREPPIGLFTAGPTEVTWMGVLTTGMPLQVTFVVTIAVTETAIILNRAQVYDGEETTELTAMTIANGFAVYLPIVLKGS